MTEHDVKCWPQFFDTIESGQKPFELRKNDRNYQVGDTMLIREWNPSTKKYSGRQTRQLIISKLDHRAGAGCAAEFGLREGYVILGIAADPT
jgi:hypothetical protein